MGAKFSGSGCQAMEEADDTSPMAPWSIQSLSRASCSGVRLLALDLLPLGGITGSAWWAADLKRRLSADRPGTRAGPESPPFLTSAGVSRMSSAFALVRLWQARQLARKMGRTSFSKSTGVERLRAAMGRGFSAAKELETNAQRRVATDGAPMGRDNIRMMKFEWRIKSQIRGTNDEWPEKRGAGEDVGEAVRLNIILRVGWLGEEPLR